MTLQPRDFISTDAVHEVIDHGHEPRTATDPAEAWINCSCGWSWDSIESIGGPVGDVRAAWQEHVDEASDEGPDCGEVA